MIKASLSLLLISASLVLGPGVATGFSEEPVWARVTVLLEPDGKPLQPRFTLVPGGIWSVAEAEALGMETIDRRISERVERLAETVQQLEQTMRLGTLMVRQLHLQLQPGQTTQLPILDLDPRYCIDLTLTELKQDAWGFTTEIQLYPDEHQELLWSGQPISFTLHDADLHDILKTFSTLTGHSIVCDPEIEGSVTADLHSVPWDQALHLVLRINQLGYQLEGDEIHVVPLESMPEPLELDQLWQTEVRGRRAPGEQIIVAGPSSMAGRVVLVIEDTGSEAPSELEQSQAMPLVRKLEPITLDPGKDGTGVAIVRGTVTREGRLEKVKVLRSPSSELGKRIQRLVGEWQIERFFDFERTAKERSIVTREAVVGFGLRLSSSRVMSIPDHISIDLDLAPSTQEGLFVIKVIVRDLDSGRILSQPRVTARSGHKAQVRSGFVMPEGGEYSFYFEALPEAATNTLSYHAQVTKNGSTISEHRASIRLQ